VSVAVAGQTAHTTFVGLTPRSVSPAQANVVVPNVMSGGSPVVITVGGTSSNAGVIRVAGK
jgi:uncharacterized protein (TIGR03437 family)